MHIAAPSGANLCGGPGFAIGPTAGAIAAQRAEDLCPACYALVHEKVKAAARRLLDGSERG